MGLRPPFGSVHQWATRPPLDQVERTLARLMVLADDKQLLARCTIVARGNIAHPAVGNIKAIDNGEAESPRTLDNATTHVRV